MKVTDEAGVEQPGDLRAEHVGGDSPAGTTTVIQEVPAGVDKNPLGEPEITVKVREGFEFYHMGTLVRAGDRFPMAISQARAASMFVDEVQGDGQLRAVPHEQQQTGSVPRASLAGMARHERIGALEDEEKRLEVRLEEVRAQKRHEAEAAQAAQAVPGAQPAPGTVNSVGPASPSPAHTPGTPGAPGNTAVPARPGEPSTGQSGGTPTANSGPTAKR